ncbi:MAG: MarC family protein [Flavobacteriales bacterium]|nr:MarC family protein [Flavobacteriales bacterium]
MGLNWVEIGTASMVLFAVIDIIGSIPLIIELRGKVGHLQTEKASIVSLFIMIAFLFLGESILSVIGIDVNSFAIAGSFILFFMALEMILGIKLYKDDIPETASIVPLAFPIIAGAGSMTSILSLRAEFASINIVIAIVLNMILVYAVLKLTTKIEKLLGKGGIAIIRKVFGIILLAIAVKLFRSNIGLLS